MKRFVLLIIGVTCLLFDLAEGQVSKSSLDFSKAIPDPQTGQLCVMQQVCIADLVTVSKSSFLAAIVSKSYTVSSTSNVNWFSFLVQLPKKLMVKLSTGGLVEVASV